MAALVGGVTEEAGFRGYLQGALEADFGGPVAIAITALVMAPVHAATQGFVWTTLLFYLLVDVMLGASAWLTRSIIPGVIVHSTGLLVFFAFIWPHDAHRQLVGKDATDAWFWLHLGQAVVFAVLTVLAFRRLAHVAAPE